VCPTKCRCVILHRDSDTPWTTPGIPLGHFSHKKIPLENISPNKDVDVEDIYKQKHLASARLFSAEDIPKNVLGHFPQNFSPDAS